MWLALLLCWLQGPTPAVAEARIDFFSVSNASEDVEIEVTAEALAKDAKADSGAKPKKATRYLNWSAGGHDNAELARLVAQALEQAGFDATSDGAETIVKNATALSVHTKSWKALGAQVWAVVPKGAEKGARPQFSVTFEPRGKVGRGACVVSTSAKTAGPKPIDGDDVAAAKFPDGDAGAPASKPKDGKAANPKEPPKPAPKPAAGGKDAKGRPAAKPLELKIGIPTGSDGGFVRAAIERFAADATWKIARDGATGLRVDGAPEGGAPQWAAIRYAGEGETTIGVRIAAPAAGGDAQR